MVSTKHLRKGHTMLGILPYETVQAESDYRHDQLRHAFGRFRVVRPRRRRAAADQSSPE